MEIHNHLIFLSKSLLFATLITIPQIFLLDIILRSVNSSRKGNTTTNSSCLQQSVQSFALETPCSHRLRRVEEEKRFMR